MRRLLITFAALTLPVVAAVSAAGPAAAASAPTPAYAPGQVVVKFDRQGSGRAVDLPAGVGVGEATAALRDNPHVDYAVPNYIAVASARIPNDPGTVPGKPGPAGGWVQSSGTSCPAGRSAIRRRARTSSSRAAESMRSAPGTTSSRLDAPAPRG